jgi:hypothetical protein
MFACCNPQLRKHLEKQQSSSSDSKSISAPIAQLLDYAVRFQFE